MAEQSEEQVKQISSTHPIFHTDTADCVPSHTLVVSAHTFGISESYLKEKASYRDFSQEKNFRVDYIYLLVFI